MNFSCIAQLYPNVNQVTISIAVFFVFVCQNMTANF